MRGGMEEANNEKEMGWWRGRQRQDGVTRGEGWSHGGEENRAEGQRGKLDMYAETGKEKGGGGREAIK